MTKINKAQNELSSIIDNDFTFFKNVFLDYYKLDRKVYLGFSKVFILNHALITETTIDFLNFAKIFRNK